MKVTSKTKYKDFQAYDEVLTEASRMKLTEAAEAAFKPCHTLTLNEFWGLLGGNYSILGDMHEPSVLQVYWLRRFKDFCEEFTKTCNKLKIKDPQDELITQGCVQVTPQENMLLSIREYFGLSSFADAAERTIGEYILMRKDRYNRYKMTKNKERIQLSNIHKK